jgi:hypothetical protein
MFWCLGMYGSASTWAYNVAQKIAASLAPATPVIPLFVARGLPDCDETSGTLVVKTHATDVARELGRRARAIIITIRDPRDAVASLMQHNGAPFDLALKVTEASAATCARFIAHRRAVLFKFEDRFFDDPATVERIAAMLPGALPQTESRRIFDELRRDSVDAFIANLEALPTTERSFDELTGQWDTYDEATGWHKHHAGRTAEVGRWRCELSDRQAMIIQDNMQDLMARFGYLPISSRPRRFPLRIGQYDIVA